MKIMSTDSSATVRESRTNTIMNVLRRRAQAVLNDTSIDPESRAVIRYALEINDPWLAKLVRYADAGESVSDTFDFSQTPETEDDPNEKIEALAELICCGDQSAAALFVLMGTLENSVHPKALANTVKHFAFAHCAESNLYGLVDGQLAVVESELLAQTSGQETRASANLGLSPLIRTMFEASLLRFFNTAKLEYATRITLWRNRPPARAVSQEALKGRFRRGRHRRPVHLLNRSKFLYWPISPHLLN
jgi:hypothetical protein